MDNFRAIQVLVRHRDNIVEAGLSTTLADQTGIRVQPVPPDMTDGSDLILYGARAGVDVLVSDYETGLAAAEAGDRPSAYTSLRWPRILIITERGTQFEIRAALERGIRGYLTYGCGREDVSNAVRNLAQGIRHLGETAAHRLADDMSGRRLTAREAEVLKLVASGCANKVIAARLHIELATVKVHMASVLDKLGAGNRTEAVAIATQRGLLRLEPGPLRATPARHPDAQAPTAAVRVPMHATGLLPAMSV